MPGSEQITEWLTAWRNGDEQARDHLFNTLYPQLQRIAGRLMDGERADHSLEPSALVNELCVRLFASQPISYQDRAHFFALAAQMMRRILIDHARAAQTGKRGGERQRVSLSAVDGCSPGSRYDDLLALDLLLSRLANLDARAARVVELRFFGGLQEEEVAEVLGVSEITVKRDWKSARAWLVGQLQSE